MKPVTLLPVLLVTTTLFGAVAHAQSTPQRPTTKHDAALDPYAQVYLVSSADTYRRGIQPLLRSSGLARRDSLGNALMISKVQMHQVSDVTAFVHNKENRCGGFFSFATLAEAENFIRNDRSAQAVRKSMLATYTLDNQATVNPWLGQVQQTNIYNTINTLQAYQNRYYTSPTGKTSAEWIRNSWQALAGSRSDVSSELFTACTDCSTQPSVILTVQGTDLPSEVVVLGAHLDSIISGGNGNTNQRAPGADDDASGIATLTEVIRIAMASGWKPKRTVKFMGYAAEEVGLNGSEAISNSFRNAGVNVVGVMQLDMTNYKVGSGSDMKLITDYSNTDLKTFFTQLFDAYLAPLGATRGTYTCNYGCSDHASWTAAGYPAAMMFEGGTASGGYNPNIHSSNDTLANMGNSAQNSVKFAQFGLAFLGELAKTSGGGNPPTNQAPIANFTSSANGLTVQFTDTSSDSDGSIVSRAWTFGDGTTSTATSPSKTYSAAGTYSVALRVTDDDGATNTRTASVTVSAGGGGTVLSSGVPVSLPAQATGTVSANYTIVVPAGRPNLVVTISGGSGDADLYVRRGSAPTSSTYTCRSNGSTNAETCTINAPTAATYYINVRAYNGYSGVTLKATY